MDLHAVVIKKPIKLEKAKKLAKDIIKDKNKHFYRETASSYRFRNIPKTKFIESSYKSKEITPEITLVFGKMKNLKRKK